MCSVIPGTWALLIKLVLGAFPDSESGLGEIQLNKSEHLCACQDVLQSPQEHLRGLSGNDHPSVNAALMPIQGQ